MSEELSEHEFVAMLRIKNEARWIAQVLESASPLCDRLFVLDDHSTDDTVAICQSFQKVTVFPSPFTGLNEARDKNWLFDQVMAACKPTWILCIDGDEVLPPATADRVKRHVRNSECNAFSFRIVFLWDDPKIARADRIYGDFWRPSLFRPFHPDPGNEDHAKVAHECRWMSTPFGRKVGNDEPNLHCSSVPQRYLGDYQRLPGELLHYGYLNREDRVRKLDYYNSIDWLNRAEDSYKHMTQGDQVSLDELPRVRQLVAEGKISQSDANYLIDAPPSAYLVHAGPIEVRPY